MIKVTPIPLYKNISGRSLFESDDPVFKEYRKRWGEQPLQFNAGNFPLFLDIEVTNMCNLRCTFCATTYFDSRVKRQLIAPELVYKVLDEGKKNGLYGAKFNDRGEPLLHPQLVDFVGYAKKCGLVDIYFNTNAMLLTEEKSIRLIEAGLDRISISIEGASAEVYESYRIGAKFETVVKNVRNLWELRNKIGTSKPLIRIQSVLLPEIEQKLEEYKSFWGTYADEISVLEYKEESDQSRRLKRIAYPWACHQLWQRMVVWCNGSILPCNEDDRGLLVIGNIREMSIKEAWNSGKMSEIREVHRSGNAHLINACDDCYLRDAQIKKLIKNSSNCK
jgi:radical SAM protein with 4Fe4S-binding SPASM domain